MKILDAEIRGIKVRKIVRIAAPIVVLVAGIGVVQALVATKPPPEKKDDALRLISLYVDEVLSESVTISITAQGEVRPKTEIDLVPQVSGRVILSRLMVRMEDALSDPDYDQRFADAGGWRRMLGVPMLRAGEPIGAIVVGWAEPGSISVRHEELLKTFADQAVIAIENVRLFNETNEALERQTATAEILKVFSSSPTDVRPVFDAIARSAAKLFAPGDAGILMRDGERIQLRAVVGPRVTAANLDQVRNLFPVPFDPKNVPAAKAMADRSRP